MPRSIRKEGGFTLIEIFVVIAIISILAMIAIISFSKYDARASNAAALSDIQNFRTVMEATYSENSFYPW